MARSENPHQLKGKIGDLVYYQRYGKTYVRSAPTRKRKENPSNKLVQSRSRFALANETVRGLKEVINETYQEFKGKTSLYHRALGETNLFAIKVNENGKPEINFNTLPIALGTLNPPNEPNIHVTNLERKIINLNWDASLGEKKDTLTWVIVLETKNSNYLDGEITHTAIIRETETAQIDLTDLEDIETVYVYAYFRNAEKSRNSSSIYCGKFEYEEK